MTTLPTRDEVWPRMPRSAGGPEWGALIDDAIEGLREALEYNEAERLRRDPSDFEHEWADGWVPVYNKHRADKFAALDLWASSEVEDEVAGMGGFPEPFTFTEAYGVALYAAARLTMGAVLAIWQQSDDEEEE